MVLKNKSTTTPMYDIKCENSISFTVNTEVKKIVKLKIKVRKGCIMYELIMVVSLLTGNDIEVLDSYMNKKTCVFNKEKLTFEVQKLDLVTMYGNRIKDITFKCIKEKQ